MAQKDAKLWTADVVGNWARSTLTELNCPSDTCEEISGRFVTFGFNGAVLASLTIEQWELLVPGVKLTGFRLALFNAWNLVLSQTSHDGLDKGKKRDASRSDDDAADSTTRDASEVRKRARSVDVDDNNNESVERRKRPRPPIHSASDVPEKIRALREAIGKAALTEDILKDPAVCSEIPFPSVSGNPVRFDVKSGNFAFFGREKIVSLLEKMRLLASGKFIKVRGNGGNTQHMNVYGSSGYGKSFLLAAAVTLLLREGHRVVFIANAKTLLKSPPLKEFREAFCVAYPELIDAIFECDEIIDIANTVVKSKGPYLLVVDQMNALELSAAGGQGATALQIRESIVSLKLACSAAVWGYSANNENAKSFYDKQRDEHDFLCYGGLSETEFKAWCDRHIPVATRAPAVHRFTRAAVDAREAKASGSGASNGHVADSDPAYIRELIIAILRDDLGAVPRHLSEVLNAVNSSPMLAGYISLDDRALDVLSEVMTSLALSIDSNLDTFFDDPSKRDSLKDESVRILAGRLYARVHSVHNYDHRWFYFDPLPPPGDLTGHIRAVCSIAWICLARHLREKFSADDEFLSAAFVSSCVQESNPVIRGFRAEQIVISAIRKWGLEFRCGETLLQFATPIENSFFDSAADTVPIVPSRCVQYVPTSHNMKYVDSVLRFDPDCGTDARKRKATKAVSAAMIAGVQITISPIGTHLHSLAFFARDLDSPFRRRLSAECERYFVWIVRDAEAEYVRSTWGNHWRVVEQPGHLRPRNRPRFTEVCLSFSEVCHALNLDL
eukprot:Opistho-2@91743